MIVIFCQIIDYLLLIIIILASKQNKVNMIAIKVHGIKMIPTFKNWVQGFKIAPIFFRDLVHELLLIFRIYNLPWQSCERVIVCWIQLDQ